MPRLKPFRIAYFISPHGYGHAARSCAIMEALGGLDALIAFEIFTTVPVWFFKKSLAVPFTYHRHVTDIGLQQPSAFEPDMPATLKALDGFLPFRSEQVQALAGILEERGCKFVLCDIAPIGISVARQAGLTSVLIENFTWDWIYAGYREREAGFEKHSRYLEAIFQQADFRLQTEPICVPQSSALHTSPVSRRPRRSRQEIRAELNLAHEQKLVLISMEGIAGRYPFLGKLTDSSQLFYLLPGAGTRPEKHASYLLLPQESAFYHPDLVHAADAVIAKAGYSTIAEIYAAGVPFGYIPAQYTRETGPLLRFIEQELMGIRISEEDYYQGIWLGKDLPRLLTMPRRIPPKENGADQAAHYIHHLFKREHVDGGKHQ